MLSFSERPVAVYCLGDLVGYGARPNETISLIREHTTPTIMGNYDDDVGFDHDDCGYADKAPDEDARGKQSLLSTRAATTEDNKAYLRTLHPGIYFDEGKRFRLVHGSPRRMNEYLFEDHDARSLARIAQGAETDALAFGHTQEPWVKEIDSALMVTVGSVGKPKNGDTRAAWALLTGEPGQPVQVEMRRVPYDMVNMTDAIHGAEGLSDHFAIDIETARAS